MFFHLRNKPLAGRIRLLPPLCALLFFFGNGLRSAQGPSDEGGLPEPGVVLHTGGLYSFGPDFPFVFSRDGRWLAFSADDKSIQVWDTAEGRLLRTITEPAGRKCGAFFSPDSRWLATLAYASQRGGPAGTATIWELSSGKEVASLQLEHLNTLTEFSADGRLLAYADKTFVKVVDWKAQREVFSTEKPAEDSPRAPALSPDGGWVAYGSSNSSLVSVWEVATGQELRSAGSPDHLSAARYTERITGLVPSPDARWLAIVTGRETTLLEVRGRSAHKIDIFEPRKVLFSSSGETVALAGYADVGGGSKVELWETNSGRQSRVLNGPESGVLGLEFTPDGQWLAAVGRNNTERGEQGYKFQVRVWEAKTGREALAANYARYPIALGPSGRWVVVKERGPKAFQEVVTVHPLLSEKFLAELKGETSTAAVLAVTSQPAPCKSAGGGQGPPELVLQSGHLSRVLDLKFSPDGCWLASVSRTEGKLWELPSGREVRTLAHGRGDEIASGQVEFSSDSQLVAIPSQRGILLWDVKTGKELPLIPLRNAVRVAFSPDGRLAASIAKGSKYVEILEVPGGRPVATIGGFLFVSPEHLAFSPDGRWFAAATPGEARLWQVNRWGTGQVLISDTSVGALKFDPASRSLWVGVRDQIRRWDLLSLQEQEPLKIGRYVYGIAFANEGKWLIAAGDESATVWDLSTKQQVRFGGRELRTRRIVDVSRDGRWLASGDQDSVRLRDVATGIDWKTLTGKTVPFGEATLSLDDRWLAWGTASPVFSPDDQSARVWNLSAGEMIHRIRTPGVNHLSLSPDGRLLAWTAPTGWGENKTGLVDLTTGRELPALPGHFGGIYAFSFSPDGRWLATGGFELDSGSKGDDRTRVRIWEVGSWREALKIEGDPVQMLAFGPDSNILVGITRLTRTPQIGPPGPPSVRVWEVPAGRIVREFSLGDTVTKSAFSPDLRLLATTGLQPFDEAVKVWDVQTGRVLTTIRTGKFATLALSTDGKMLATAGWDYVISFWDVGTGRKTGMLSGHSAGINQLIFRPEGSWLFSTSEDGTARLWDVTTGRVAALLVALRNTSEWLVLTPEGLFDGSPRAIEELVAWRFGAEIAPLEIFFNEFYYPGLLADILKGNTPKAPRDITQLDRRQPELKLSVAGGQPSAVASTRTVVVKLEVAEAPPDAQRPLGSGVRDVRLFRNGSLVKVWRGDAKLDGNGKAAWEVSVPIVAGENRFAAYAFNHDNIKSADAALVITGAESLRRKGTAYIVAIGVNKYANPDYNLGFAVADAQAFAEELKRQQISLGSFEHVEVISLLDQDATRSNILRVLNRLSGTETPSLPQPRPTPAGPTARPSRPPAKAQQPPRQDSVQLAQDKVRPAEPEDAVFVFYAGHGTAAGPRFYLIPHDLGYAGKRTELDEAAVRTILDHSISDLDLERAFESIDAGQILLVIDACNSGQALEAEEKRRGPMNSKGLAQLAYEKGMYILTAAQGYQAALEASKLGHGLLTYSLVEEGLKTVAPDAAPQDGQVVMREWLDYTTLRVPQLQEAQMQEAEQAGRTLSFMDGEDTRGDRRARGLQRPRVFYRREPETQPPIIAKLAAKERPQ